MSLKVVLVLLLLMKKCSCSKYCHKLPQGVSRMRNGVDITRLDLLPLDVNEDNGFRQPIIDFHCEEGKTILFGEKMYEIPDEVTSINSVPSNKLEVEINIYKKSSELRKNMGIDASLNSSGGFFSASASYKKMLYTISNTSRHVEEVKAFVSTNRVNIHPAWGMQMSEAAKSAASSLFVGDEKSIANGCQRFIQTFGTHFLQYGKFGGSMRLVLETEEDYFKKHNEKSIKVQTKMTFIKLINIESKLNGKKVNVDEEFSRNTRQKLSIHGGKASFTEVIDVVSWQSSVYENPWLFNAKVAPIYDFFTNTTIRKIFKRAVEIYIDKAYLGELYSEMNSYKVPPSLLRTLQQYKTQDLHLSKLDQPPHGNVTTLAGVIDSYLNGPEWFKQTTQLCLKWSAVNEQSDYFECGGVSSPVLCAPPGKMTEYYMDYTNGYGSGCHLSWGIMTSGEVPDWFKDVKICYKWKAGGTTTSRCGPNKAKGLFCAQVGNFTQPYHDLSYYRSNRNYGYCNMFWKLVIPDEAPVWLKNTRFCFDETDRKDFNHAQCVSANTYTPYIHDWGKRVVYRRWGMIMG